MNTQQKQTEQTEMIKLTDFSQEQFSSFLLSYKETSLSLKINIHSNQDLPMLEIIENEMGKLIHLKELEIVIPKNTILTVKGYTLISNAIKKLDNLHKLSLKIDCSCFLQDEGLAVLQNTINTLKQLVSLKLSTNKNNCMTAEAAQQFLDSLAINNNLKTLHLHWEVNQSSKTNGDNLHFWRGLSNLSQLEKLSLSFDDRNYCEQDLNELYSHITNLPMLRRLSLILTNGDLGQRQFQNLFPYIGKLVELRSLKIDCINNSISIKPEIRNLIIMNLNNLTLLEKLQLYEMEQQLFCNNPEEYLDLIGNLKNLQELSLNVGKKKASSSQQQLIGQSLLQLRSLTHLELVFKTNKNSLDYQLVNDLSVSFSQMKNLLDLILEFETEMSEKSYNVLGESFLHLLKVERLNLKFKFNTDRRKAEFLFNIRYLQNLKKLELVVEGMNFEEVILLESIAELRQLEELNLQRTAFFTVDKGFSNLKTLCNTLKNLRKLKSLKFNLLITTLAFQEQLDMLENAFEYLQEINQLSIDFNIKKVYEGHENVSLIKNLMNLKEIDIQFLRVPLNIFGNSDEKTTFSKLETCSLNFVQTLSSKQFINIFDSLSKQSNLLKLEIKSPGLDDYDLKDLKVQFELICSQFKRTKKLIIKDNTDCTFYTQGFKQMKSLQTLCLNSDKTQFNDQNIKELDEALLQLTHLKKIKVNFFQDQTILNVIERLSASSLKQLRNLKKIILKTRILTLNKDVEISSIRKRFEFTKALSLDYQSIQQESIENVIINNQMESIQEFQNMKETDDPDLFNDPQCSSVKEKKKIQQHLKNSIHNRNPVKLVLDFYLQESDQICLNEFDFQNMMYLDSLALNFHSSKDLPLTLPLNLPLSDLISEHRLITLSLYLSSCIISQELISYFSRNLKYLTHLQFLDFSTEQYQGYYHLLLDSFSQLISLKGFYIDIIVEENGAISLGNSLHSMKQLESLDLYFNKGSTFGIEGISSIMSGVKQTTKLRKLNLNLSTSQIMDEVSQNQIEKSTISHLKMLENLEIQLRGEENIRTLCSRQFMQSIGSLAYLNTLRLKTKKSNPFNQEMLDDLIASINSLQFLESKNVTVYLNNQEETITISQDFAKLFNQKPKSILTISTKENRIKFNQDHSQIYLKSNSMDNLHIDFLEYLDDSIKVKFKLCEIKIVKRFKLCTARKVEIIMDYFQSEGEEIGTACELISRMQNTLKLKMIVNISGKTSVDTSLIQLAQILRMLNSLKVLHLTIFQNGESIQCESLIQMLNVLKNIQELKQLRNLYLKTKQSSINKKMVTQIQKVIIRLVNFNSKKQSQYGSRPHSY